MTIFSADAGEVTAGCYRIPVACPTGIDAPAPTKLAGPWPHRAAGATATVPIIEIHGVLGATVAELVKASRPDVTVARGLPPTPAAALWRSLPLELSDVPGTREAFPVVGLRPTARVDRDAPPSDLSEPRAFRAFKDLGEWLGATDEQVAEAIGIGRTTVYAWSRDGREPRRGTARRIHEYHAVLASLRRRLGPEDLTAWLLGGETRRRDLLLAGRLEEIEADVDVVLFRGRGRGADLAWRGEDTVSVEADAATRPPRPRARKTKRARLR